MTRILNCIRFNDVLSVGLRVMYFWLVYFFNSALIDRDFVKQGFLISRDSTCIVLRDNINMNDIFGFLKRLREVRLFREFGQVPTVNYRISKTNPWDSRLT